MAYRGLQFLVQKLRNLLGGKMSIPILNSITSQPTLDELQNSKNRHGFIKSLIAVDLQEIIDRNYEEFLDLISVKAAGSELLMDVTYDVVGNSPFGILIEVNGDVSGILETSEIVARNIEPDPETFETCISCDKMFEPRLMCTIRQRVEGKDELQDARQCYRCHERRA
jgi:hypothetical protein